ncbi:5,10-methenyltetrahydrofolate synthetase [Thiovulum sp. ES]|nr:5,10-methenyltetrahydrofolate synthetase [Thiovulum sp. ES]
MTKEQFRQKGRERISNRERRVLSRKIEKELNRVIYRNQNRNILFYSPLKNEVDISNSLKFWNKRRNVFLPKIGGETFSAIPFRVPLKKSKFGTFEPSGKSKMRNLDIAIVPILGIDSTFRRVGFGKGMYDRFFPKLRKIPFTIFVQNRLNFSKKVLTEKHDIFCDVVLFGKSETNDRFYLKR